MRRPEAPSLQARLAWRLTAVFLVALTAALGGMGWRAATTIDSLEDRSLQAQARDIVRHLRWSPGRDAGGRGDLELTLPPSLAASYARWSDTFLYVVYGPGGSVLAASSPAAPALFAAHLPAEAPALFHIDQPGQEPYYGYVHAEGPLRVAVAQGRLHGDVLIDSLVEEFLEASAWWLALVVLAAVLVGVLTIRRSLAPLAAVSAQARGIGPGTTGVRLREDRLPREVRPLVAAVNQALDRLEAAFEVQRQFTADAAHELRTPLAVLTARVDGLAPGETQAGLRRDIDRLNRLVEQLLGVARLEATPPDLSAAVDLRRLASETVADLAPRAVSAGRGLALAGAEDPVWVRGDPASLARALTNLVENALAYTPRGTTVEVTVAPDATVRVRDHGPGVPAGERHAIFRRFHRGAAAAPGGAGLGLALVAGIAAAHGGSVSAEDAAGGGACFTLRLRPVHPPGRTPAAAGAEVPPAAA